MRLTTSSQTPRLAASRKVANGEKSRGQDAPGLEAGRPSKWNTLEYYVYYLVFITVVPMMFYVPYTASKESNPDYHKFAPLLSGGWILGRRVDNSDQQYASFRDNIPYMMIVVVIHPILRIAFERIADSLNIHTSAEDQNMFASSRSKKRVMYDAAFALIFLAVLHGFSAFKVLLILYMNFGIATKLPRNWIPPATWIFNLGILFANELCHGYPYSKIAGSITPRPPATMEDAKANWGTWLDSHGGLIPRWEILFNITVLRLVSFNLDYYWSLENRGKDAVEKKQLNPSSLSERERISTPPPRDAYSLLNYLSYVLYSPLYLAGPILTFNDYHTQLRERLPSVTLSGTVLYGVRFLLTLLSMELILHFIYAVAISKSDPNWSHLTPFQLSMLGFFNLHIIWLKLLLPWRFFRLWALLDGIDPPENVIRCMSNNYSALAFWRGWHRSYNRWIVRYLYVPLGGSGRGTSKMRGLVNLLVVFTFVALWHDISARLLAWSWLIVLFLLPETICSTVLFPARKYNDRPETYRMICGIGAVGNILMMMAANLVGFALGVDGLKSMVKGIVSGYEGWAFLGAACATLFVGSMVMFELREDERRRGIDLKC